MDESRKQFEEWYASSWRLRDDELRQELAVENNGDYIYSSAYNSWQAWQASRAAIDIELPVKNDISDDDYPIPDLVDWDDGRNAGIQECAEAIRAAGIKVKE